MKLPPLEDLMELEDDETPPQIRDIKVLEVERGLFITAKIGWQTDEIANSMISYGINHMNLSSRSLVRVIQKRIMFFSSNAVW